MNESGAASAGVGDKEAFRDERWQRYVADVSAGDESALAALYDETSSLVYTIAMRILGNPADAEEATVDVYAQVWRAASGFRKERGTVAGWLVTMARSRAIDGLRTRARRAAAEHSASTDAAIPEAEPVAAFDEQRRVRAALAALPAEQREVIELAAYEGYTQSELAEKMSLPLGTVKTRMRLGMLKLREKLIRAGVTL